MTPLFQAIFACAVASARYARLRSSTRWSYPNLQKQGYTNINPLNSIMTCKFVNKVFG